MIRKVSGEGFISVFASNFFKTSLFPDSISYVMISDNSDNFFIDSSSLKSAIICSAPTFAAGQFSVGSKTITLEISSFIFCAASVSIIPNCPPPIMPKILLITTCKFCITNSFQKKLLKYRFMHQKLLVTKKPLVGIIMGSSSDSRIMHGAAEILDSFSVAHEDQIISAHRTPQRLDEYAKHAEKNQFKVIIAGAGGAAHLPGMIASHTTIPVIGVPIMVYNDKQMKKTDKNKYSAFGGLDSLLSISEMPTGSPVVAVGVNKASNAGIYALKILGNSYPEIKKKLKKHKFDQYTSVLKESEELKKIGLSKFVKKKFR